jgi:hypothetical protein
MLSVQVQKLRQDTNLPPTTDSSYFKVAGAAANERGEPVEYERISQLNFRTSGKLSIILEKVMEYLNGDIN